MEDANMVLVAIFIGYAAVCIAVGWAASQRGRSETGWFFIALLFSPIIALLLLLVAGPGKGGGGSGATGPGTAPDHDAVIREWKRRRLEEDRKKR